MLSILTPPDPYNTAGHHSADWTWLSSTQKPPSQSFLVSVPSPIPTPLTNLYHHQTKNKLHCSYTILDTRLSCVQRSIFLVEVFPLDTGTRWTADFGSNCVFLILKKTKRIVLLNICPAKFYVKIYSSSISFRDEVRGQGGMTSWLPMSHQLIDTMQYFFLQRPQT